MTANDIPDEGHFQNPVPAAPVDENTWVLLPRRSGFFSQLWGALSRWKLTFYLMQLTILTVYQKAILSWLWLIIRPFIMAIGATFVIRDVIGVDSGDIPYPLFVLASLPGLILFQRGMAWCTRGLDRNTRIIQVLNCPRLPVYWSTIAPAAVEAFVVVICFFLAVGYYYFHDGVLYIKLTIDLWLIIPSALALLLIIKGVCLFTSILQLYAMDVWFTLRYVIPIAMFSAPALYPLSAVPEAYREAALLNPISAPFLGIRYALFGMDAAGADYIFYSLGIGVILNILGLMFFLRWEAYLVDAS